MFPTLSCLNDKWLCMPFPNFSLDIIKWFNFLFFIISSVVHSIPQHNRFFVVLKTSSQKCMYWFHYSLNYKESFKLLLGGSNELFMCVCVCVAEFLLCVFKLPWKLSLHGITLHRHARREIIPWFQKIQQTALEIKIFIISKIISYFVQFSFGF